MSLTLYGTRSLTFCMLCLILIECPVLFQSPHRSVNKHNLIMHVSYQMVLLVQIYTLYIKGPLTKQW